MRIPPGDRRHGYTLIEVLVSVAITSLLMIALGGSVLNALAASEDSRRRGDLTREARFALDRVTNAIARTGRLLAPLAEDPSTGNSEAVTDPGFLAVTLDPSLDRDLDGIADADNDGDGRVDEDPPRDVTNDGRPGVHSIDDDNSGITDISFAGSADDDETGFVADEDPINGIDDDGDGTIDEDPPADMNGDGAPGVAGVDDDGDGQIDEGDSEDDDEDGTSNEDWFDVVTYTTWDGQLYERTPDLAPSDGADFTYRSIASDVSAFRVERLPRDSRRVDLVAVSLTLSRDGISVTLSEQVRVGGPQ